VDFHFEYHDFMGLKSIFTSKYGGLISLGS
jgi:hypothetical protein